MKVAQCQGVKEAPSGCTHVMLNMIGEVYEWFDLSGGTAMVFFIEWTPSWHEKKDLLECEYIRKVCDA